MKSILLQTSRTFDERLRSVRCLLCAGLALPLGCLADDVGETANIPPGAPISGVVIVRENIFDLSNEDENRWLYRWMNRLHVVTRPETIRHQLLFKPGDGFDARLLEESERILRSNDYLYDASIKPVLNPDGSVDIDVRTKDVWTLLPEFSFSREGGENEVLFGIEEDNFLGRGQHLQVTWADDVERTSTILEFSDRQLGSSWVGVDLGLADSSDGHTIKLDVIKPFYALDSRGAGGLSLFDTDRRSTLYALGDEAAEYQHERHFARAFTGWSAGLHDGWVRRWTAGMVYDENHFSDVSEPELVQVLPADRKLVYPFIGYEILEDRYETSSNHNQIDRSEDFYLGTRLGLTLGWSDTAIGADRDALIYGLSGNYSIGSMQSTALLLAGRASGRVEDGASANALVRLSADYYKRQSNKRLFFAHLNAAIGHDLDIDNPVEIGGDSGLRGYPLRYQAGDSSVVLSVEQRYYTDWYPWRLFRVGGAVFFDVGRVWGPNPIDAEQLGWISDAGFGLRLAPTRFGTTKVIHIDIAFPIDPSDDIDSVQVLLEAKRSF